MAANNVNIEEIVRQVLASMSGQAPASAPAAAGPIPKTSRVAVLSQLEKFEIKDDTKIRTLIAEVIVSSASYKIISYENIEALIERLFER